MRSKGLIAVATGSLCASGMCYAQQTVTYGYDALGRLTHTQIQSGVGQGGAQVFSYDAAGNRLLYQVSTNTQNTLNMSGAANQTTAGTPLTVNFSGSSVGGTVTFTENGVFLGSTSVANGQASILLESYSKGTHTITASYSGDGIHAAQTVTFTVRVQDLGWLPPVLKLLLSD